MFQYVNTNEGEVNTFIKEYKGISLPRKKRKMLLEFLKPLTYQEQRLVLSKLQFYPDTRLNILIQLNPTEI